MQNYEVQTNDDVHGLCQMGGPGWYGDRLTGQGRVRKGQWYGIQVGQGSGTCDALYCLVIVQWVQEIIFHPFYHAFELRSVRVYYAYFCSCVKEARELLAGRVRSHAHLYGCIDAVNVESVDGGYDCDYSASCEAFD